MAKHGFISFFLGLFVSLFSTLAQAQSCPGEVLNISAPTPGTSGTTANWTVPSGGPYKVKITTKGAKGGNHVASTIGIGGAGAVMTGDFLLLSGQTIVVTAGAEGVTQNGNPFWPSGGSGSFASIQGEAYLIVGGGGGSGFGAFDIGLPGAPGLTTQNGGNGIQGSNNCTPGAGGNNGSDGGNGSSFSNFSNGGKGIYNGALGGLGINGAAGGGAGGGGYSGGGGGCRDGGGGGGSYNLGANQSNTSGANTAGGQVIIECLGTATLTATATPTQPICATPTQGSASIDLTGDLNGYTSGGLEYAVVSGSAFSGNPTFASVTADPFSITSGTGTVADLDGETYTVRVRLKYNPTLFVDRTYTLNQYVDSEAPTATCQDLTISLDSDGNASILPADVFDGGTDNCGAVTPLSVSPSSFTCGNTGPNTVTLSANDSEGNTATCTAIVTVVDNTPPTVVCKDITVDLNSGGTASITPGQVLNTTLSNDHCGVVAAQSVSPNSFACANTGSNTVTLTANDGKGNTATCQATVSVSDGIAPGITCPANIARSTDAGLCTAVVTYATPIATDNCAVASLVLTSPAGTASGSAFPKGASTVVWKATDAASLSATCSFTVTVTDGQAPSITCPLHQTRSTDPGQCQGSVTYATPTATDNCALPTGLPQWVSGGATPTASGANSVSVFQKGATTVTWKATDGAGLTKTCTFRVTVNDTEAPVITCPVGQSVNTTAGACASAAVTYATPSATDNCTSPAPAVTRVSGPASGSNFPKGVSNVAWRAVDAAGNTKTCSFSVTVTDNVLPGIACPGNIAVTAAAGQCSAVVTYANPTATDNCAVASVLLLNGLASGSTFPQGVTTHTWRAMDDSGLTATCSFTVTVSCGTGAQGGGPEERQTVQGSKTRTVSDLTLTLAPNPAADQTVISITGLGETGGQLSVHDAQGRLMWRQEVEGSAVGSPQCTVRLEGFAAGLYFVTLRSEGAAVTERLVKVQ